MDTVISDIEEVKEKNILLFHFLMFKLLKILVLRLQLIENLPLVGFI